MSSTLIVWILVLFAAVVVWLTFLRLRGEGGAGTFPVSRTLSGTHLASGVLALVTWVGFLIAPEDSVLGGSLMGILSLAAWWITTACGLLILLRWLPARGRHVTRPQTDTWSDGAGLSVLGHGGVLVAVLYFTWAYLTSAV